jgi:hypothetical protein
LVEAIREYHEERLCPHRLVVCGPRIEGAAVVEVNGLYAPVENIEEGRSGTRHLFFTFRQTHPERHCRILRYSTARNRWEIGVTTMAGGFRVEMVASMPPSLSKTSEEAPVNNVVFNQNVTDIKGGVLKDTLRTIPSFGWSQPDQFEAYEAAVTMPTSLSQSDTEEPLSLTIGEIQLTPKTISGLHNGEDQQTQIDPHMRVWVGCGATVQSDNLARHQKEECSRSILRCPWDMVGKQLSVYFPSSGTNNGNVNAEADGGLVEWSRRQREQHEEAYTSLVVQGETHPDFAFSSYTGNVLHTHTLLACKKNAAAQINYLQQCVPAVILRYDPEVAKHQIRYHFGHSREQQNHLASEDFPSDVLVVWEDITTIWYTEREEDHMRWSCGYLDAMYASQHDAVCHLKQTSCDWCGQRMPLRVLVCLCFCFMGHRFTTFTSIIIDTPTIAVANLACND